MTYDTALPCPTFNLDEPLPDVAPAPVPPGYVLVAQADFDRMMDLIAQLQNEREADRIDHADYERLLEKERAEQIEPLPMFLTAPRLTEPVHCIPRLGRG